MSTKPAYRQFSKKKNFELFETNGDWEVYLNRPVYKEYRTFGSTRIFNTETGEDCGNNIKLYCTLFDENGQRLPEPIYDPDCYEIREIED